MANDCPDLPVPPPTCGGGPCADAKPFNAANGAVEQSFSFLQTNYGSFDISYYNLWESGGNPDDPEFGLGFNWFAYQFAQLFDHGDGVISIVFLPIRTYAGGGCGGGGGGGGGGDPGDGGGGDCGTGNGSSNVYWFHDPTPIPAPPVPCYGCIAELEQLSSGDWRLVEADGTVTVFDGSNSLIKSQTTPGGQTTEFSYDTSGSTDRIQEMRRTFEYPTNLETIESRYFEYDNGKLQYVTLRRATDSSRPIDWTDIRRLEFVYYTATESSKGNVGDLKLIKQQLPAPGSSWADDKIHLFRYYTPNEDDGFTHGLKYVLSPQGYDEMSEPEESSNNDLAPYASAYYEYDSERRVSKVAVEGGAVEETIVYSINENTDPSPDFTYDQWYRKAVITQPNGLTKTIYSNHIAQDLLIDDDDGTNQWITFSKYNSDYRLIELVHPSAIDMSGTPYSQGENDLDVAIYSSQGRIDVFTYVTGTTANGYLEFRKVQNGSGTTPVNLSKLVYTSKTVGSGETEITIYPIFKSIVYRAAGDMETSFAYNTWHSGTVQPSKITTTLPNILSTENQVNSTSATTVQEFDIVGRLVKSTDARGMITEYAYDEPTGSPTEMVQDVGGLDLTTTMTNDELGRQTESLGPLYNVNGSNVRTAKWTVYKDSLDKVVSGQGYLTGSSTYTLINPVSVQLLNKNDRVEDAVQATRGSTVEDSGKLTGSDTFTDQTKWTRWTHHEYGDGGRLMSTRAYHNIPDSGDGDPGDNYDQTNFDYDSMGWQNMIQKPNGTITRTVFDVRGLVDSVWIGTDDTDAIDTDPTGGSASGNNMTKVTQNQYDDGLEGGDGNLTKVTRQVDDTSSNDRITEMEYDWRDRLTTTIINDGSDEFQTIATLDNLGRTIVSETKRDDSGLVLIAKSETKFDARGRVYRTLTYAVSDAGSPGSWPLESNTWFDDNNNVIKSQPSGSRAFSKTTYDSVNRPTDSYYGYYDGSGSDDPETLVDNVIFSQSKTVYDAASNVISGTSKQRFHDTSGTGALNGPSGSAPNSRDSYLATWYDGIGRNTEVANYGTNGGTPPARSTSAPASSDIILVSKSIFNIAGEMEDAVDPLGKKDRTEYDDAPRVTKVTKNYGQSPTEVTHTEYSNGQMSKLIADNSTTGNQVTTYTYGVTLTNSEIASNDLLQKVTYPDEGEVVYQYNRQSDQIKLTDQHGTVHDYGYDKLGRRFKDKVTVGTGVDDSVQRIETAYDKRMRVEKVTSYDAASGGDVTSQVQYQYNDFSQVIKEYQQHGDAVNTSTSPKVLYAYEDGSQNNIRPTSMTYPDEVRELQYEYGDEDDANDQLSRIQSLTFDSGGIVDYSYLGLSQVVIQKYTEPSTDVEYTLATGTGDDPYDGGMDRFGRIINLLWQQGTTKHIDYAYTYDRVGNKKSLDTKPVGPVTLYVDELFGYDELYRLEDFKRGKLNGSMSNLNLTQDWTLDETGNWTEFVQGYTAALDQTREHSQSNEITDIDRTAGENWPTPVYDANGNMTQLPQPLDLDSYYDATWDAWNRLVKLVSNADTVAQFEYDGLDRRIIKKKYESGILTETVHFYLSTSSQVLEERIDSETDPAQQFVWGIRFVDDLVLRDKDTDSDGEFDERLYAMADPRFSILAITNASGAVQERYSYAAYGQTMVLTPSYAIRSSSSFDWEFRYTGRRLDLETALYYFRARFYHAELGRFISRDPVGYVDGMNLYRAYFAPKLTDATGFWTRRDGWDYDDPICVDGHCGLNSNKPPFNACMKCPPKTCKEVCEIATKKGLDFALYATVVCYDQMKCACVFVDPGGWQFDIKPGECPVVDRILREHEDGHIKSGKSQCPKNCKVVLARFPDEDEGRKEECRLYRQDVKKWPLAIQNAKEGKCKEFMKKLLQNAEEFLQDHCKDVR